MGRKHLRERDPQRRAKGEALMMLTGMRDWREQHPHATLKEIEQAMDERLAKLRAGMLEELVQMSPQADWSEATRESRPRCERCGSVLVSRGKQSRWLQTSGGEEVEVQRSYGTCAECEQGFSPLDDELELEGTTLTPHAHESLVRLASWVPFGPAAKLIEEVLGVQVSKSRARRLTLQAGEAERREWEEQTSALEQRLPEALSGANQQVMSADGAMVPLVGGEWAEVKTLVIGEVTETQVGEATQAEKRVSHLSYCSRLTDVAGFEQASVLEVHRRGLEHARQVAAVTDGADWLQGFIDYHRPDAVRILDFAHAAEYIAAIGEAVRAFGHFLPAGWLDGVLHRLKRDGPERVLLHLHRLTQRSHNAEAAKKLRYLCTRRAHLLYPQYQAVGWPIGSGIVESANKLVVEQRLKGAGMHWKPENVNRMLLLRNAVCNDRWAEQWLGRRKQAQQERLLRRKTQAQARLQRVEAQVRMLWLPFALALLPSPPPPSSTLEPNPQSPKGRTPAQARWGRRPVSLRGAQLQAEFAKQ